MSRIAKILSLCSLILSGAVEAKQSDDALRVVSSSRDDVVLEYRSRTYPQRPLMIGGKEYIQFFNPVGGSLMAAGKPQLPLEGILIGIPPGADVRLEIEASKFNQTEQMVVAPAPEFVPLENNEFTEVYRPDDRYYETATEYDPAVVAEIGEIATIRNQRVAKILVYPMQYIPAARTLRRLEYLRIRCSFVVLDKGTAAAWIPTEDDPLYEPMFRSLIGNYSEARLWRGTEASPPSAESAVTAEWFTEGRPYYRIPIGHDALYRLSFRELADAGLDLRTVDRDRIAMYCKGESIPILLNDSSGDHEEWFIDFYAERNRGVHSSFDIYSDTSYYWLAFDDTNPKRIDFDSTPISPPPDTARSHTAELHLEQDLRYYFGYNTDEIQNPEDVPGEGWYWRDFNPNTVWNYSTTLDTVLRSSAFPARLTVRLFGMTRTTPPSQHTCEVRVNNTLIGQVTWFDNTEAVLIQNFPDSLLARGTNTIQVKSVTTPSAVNRFYIDWMKLEYRRPLMIAADTLLLSTPQEMVGGNVCYSVSGISSDSAEVFDVTDGRRLPVISGGSGITLFVDSSDHPRRYLVTRAANRDSVSAITQKTFRGLRSDRTGADYLVITHRDFLPAAQRLADARRVRGRLRTNVVDVQDIYDEFSYGYLNPVAIRDFLAGTYTRWKQPAPTYVVMFGDACWDFKAHIATTVKRNYVPAYGNPPSDNALVSFDTSRTYLPFMLIGRIPVEDGLQADRVVTKILAYDNAPMGEWNATSLFITGGTDASEQFTFNGYSEYLITNSILPPPIAGDVRKVYKSSSVIVDGDSKGLMQDLVRDGLVYINFIGHSGGRLWNVDIGDPNDLGNTNGQLPFISSVSCNVGFFSAPNFNVLAEDFLLADNRGAIGVWAGSSVGYASVGWWLTQKFLSTIATDYGRSFGQLTTLARIHYWSINSVTSPLVIQTLQLHPLFGDPYSLFAVPLKPDIDVRSGDIRLTEPEPTADRILTVHVTYRNHGLVPEDSILVTATDAFTDVKGNYAGAMEIVPPFLIPPFGRVDSFAIPWDVRDKPGSHTVSIMFNPQGVVPEVQLTNNSADTTIYVYRTQNVPLMPHDNAVVKSGPQTLGVSLPLSQDTTRFTYTFEIDTTSSFTSPFLVTSPALQSGTLVTSWETPDLPDGQTYLWRARTHDGSKFGAWTSASFTTRGTGAGGDTVVWAQTDPDQFRVHAGPTVTVSDTGVIMRAAESLPLYVRSVGNRAYPDSDYYSIIRFGTVTVYGLYFFGTNSFIAARIDPLTGAYEAKGYSLTTSGQPDSMLNFLRSAPVGYYVAISVVRDGQTNVTTELKDEMKALGAVNIDSVRPGHAWCLISRKGNGTPLMTPLESYSPSGIAVREVELTNHYRMGTGELLSPPIGPAQEWFSLHLMRTSAPGTTSLPVSVLGMKTDSTVDTLFTVTDTEEGIELSTVNAAIHPRLMLRGLLGNTDGSSTPVLHEWLVQYRPAPDLALSPFTASVEPDTIQPGDSLTVNLILHNIGRLTSDSAKILLTAMPEQAELGHILVDSLPAGEGRTVSAKVVPPTAPMYQNLRAQVVPLDPIVDASEVNNSITLGYVVLDGPPPGNPAVEVRFDRRSIGRGDHVSPSPDIAITIRGGRLSPQGESVGIMLDEMELFPARNASTKITATLQEDNVRLFELKPELTDGAHSLTVTWRRKGGLDSVISTIDFLVSGESKLRDVYAYPNPFSRETEFTFTLTGSAAPQSVSVKIYTVAGRMIREIILPPAAIAIGFMHCSWDGRDDAGDEVANGTYLYKVGVNTGRGRLETIEKCVKVR